MLRQVAVSGKEFNNMNKKLEKVREDIKKTKARLRELQAHYKELLMIQQRLENEEIVAEIRGRTEKGGDVLETLRLLSSMQKEQERQHILFDDDDAKEVEIDE